MKKLSFAVAVTILALGGLVYSLENPKPQVMQLPPDNRMVFGKVGVTSVDADQLKAQLAKFKDQVVLVEFWAPWCAPCRQETPKTIALAAKYAVPLVLVSIDKEPVGPVDSAAAWLTYWKSGNAVTLRYTGLQESLKTTYSFPGYIPYLFILDKGKLVPFTEDKLKPTGVRPGINVETLAQTGPLTLGTSPITVPLVPVEHRGQPPCPRPRPVPVYPPRYPYGPYYPMPYPYGPYYPW